MKFSNYKKWGLFFVLAGTLGFNLSMNPEHFNNIARYERFSVQSMDWAQKADPSDSNLKSDKSAKLAKVESTDPNLEISEFKGSTREIMVGGKKGTFKAKVYSLGDDSTVVRFERLDKSPEGKVCELCGKTFVLDSKFKNIDDVNRELVTLTNDDSKSDKEASSEDEEEKPVVQKKGEATDVDLEAWAAKCDKVSDSSKLSCHKNRLIELSKYLKNTSDNAHFVTEYFNEYLKSDITRGFMNPTVKSNIFSNGFGVMQPSLEADSSLLEQANDLSEEIIAGLRSTNGKKTAEILIGLRGKSFVAQLRHSQRLLSEGLSEGNSYKLQIGLQGMQPDYQRAMLQQSSRSMLDSVSSMSSTGSTGSRDLSDLQDYVNTAMYSPYDSILTQLKTFVLNGDPANKDAKHGFVDFQIPLGFGETISSVNMTQNGSIVDTSLQNLISRIGAQTRGANIQWGTGEGATVNSRNIMSGDQNAPPIPRTAQPAVRSYDNHPTSF
jgi:hypothetical protein